MKAFLAKVKCYSKCVKLATKDAASKQAKKENEEKQAQKQTCEEEPLLMKPVATLAVTKEKVQTQDVKPAREPDVTSIKMPSQTDSPFSLSVRVPSTTSYSKLKDDVKKLLASSSSYNLRKNGHRSKREEEEDVLSQWNLDPEFLLTVSTQPKESPQKPSPTHVWGADRSRLSRTPGYTAWNAIKHTNSQECCSPTKRCLIEPTKHTVFQWNSTPVSIIPPVRFKEQLESTESDTEAITSFFETTQDEAITCSSLTSYEYEPDKKMATPQFMEYEAPTSDFQSVDDHTSTVVCEDDTCTVHEGSYRNENSGEYFQDELHTYQGQESENEQSRSTIVGSEGCVASERNYECAPRNFMTKSMVDTTHSAPQIIYPVLSDSRLEQDSALEAESPNRRNRYEVSHDYPTSERNSTIGSEDYSLKSTTEFALSGINSSSPIQPCFSNSLLAARGHGFRKDSENQLTRGCTFNRDLENCFMKPTKTACIETESGRISSTSSEIASNTSSQSASSSKYVPKNPAFSLSFPLLDQGQKSRPVKCDTSHLLCRQSSSSDEHSSSEVDNPITNARLSKTNYPAKSQVSTAENHSKSRRRSSMKRRSRNTLKERSLSVKSVRFVNASKSSHDPVEDRDNGYRYPNTFNESHSRSCYSILKTGDCENSIRNILSRLKKTYGDIVKQDKSNDPTSSESSGCKHKENGQSLGIHHNKESGQSLGIHQNKGNGQSLGIHHNKENGQFLGIHYKQRMQSPLHSDPPKHGQCPDSSCDSNSIIPRQHDSGRENQHDSLEPEFRPTTTSKILKGAEGDVQETSPSVGRPVIDNKDLSQGQHLVSQNQVSKTGSDSSQKTNLPTVCTLKNSSAYSQSASTRQNKLSIYSQSTSISTRQDKLSELKKV